MSARRRKISPAQFPPVKVAAFRKELVAYLEKGVIDFKRADAAGQAIVRLAGQPEATYRYLRNELAGAEEAELFWVSNEIVQQAFDASQDVPHISALDAPAPAGILFFEKPLPPLPMDQATRGLYLSQITLAAQTVGTAAFKNLTTEVHGVMWSYIGPGRLAVMAFGVHGAKAPTAGAIDPRIPLGYFDIPLFEATEIEEITQGQAHKAFLAFLSSLWVLMKTPTVARLSEADIATGKTVQPGLVPVGVEEWQVIPPVPASRRVQVVEMLPMRHEAKEEQETATDDTGPKATRRKSPYKWVVRGHWRNQAVGKNRQQRQLTWIASHLRGNPDGPLKNSEKVYTWRGQ